jgi:hypothetical protein
MDKKLITNNKTRKEIAGYKCMILHLLQQIDDEDLTPQELELAGILMRSKDVQALLDKSVKDGLNVILNRDQYEQTN